MFDDKRPLKAKNLKVLDHLGTLYATFDGSSMWKIDKVAFELMKMCDGKRNFDEIVRLVAQRASLKEEDVKSAIKPIFEELSNLKFIVWID